MKCRRQEESSSRASRIAGAQKQSNWTAVPRSMKCGGMGPQSADAYSLRAEQWRARGRSLTGGNEDGGNEAEIRSVTTHWQTEVGGRRPLNNRAYPAA